MTVSSTAEPAWRRRGRWIDLAYVVLATAGTAVFFYRAHEAPSVRASEKRVDEARLSSTHVLEAERIAVAAQRERVVRASASRDSIDRITAALRSEIPQLARSITAGEQRSADLAARAVDLRGRVESRRAEVSGLESQVRFLGERRDDLAANRLSLRDTLVVARQRNASLAHEVATLRASVYEPSWGVFSSSTSVAAALEVRRDTSFLTLLGARDLFARRRWNVGVTGSLGFGNEAGAALRSGGLYANYDLVPGRGSVDLSLGLSHLCRLGSPDRLDPTASLTLRAAPYARERAFLLLGTTFTDGALALLAGVGFGRR